MTKIPKQAVEQELVDTDIWTDIDEYLDAYWEDYWDDVSAGEMSWQWYMKLKQHKDWYVVVINPIHKNTTIANWILSEYFGECQFEYEHEHFLIEREDVATIVALRWA